MSNLSKHLLTVYADDEEAKIIAQIGIEEWKKLLDAAAREKDEPEYEEITAVRTVPNEEPPEGVRQKVEKAALRHLKRKNAQRSGQQEKR